MAAEEEQPPALPPRTTSIQRSAASGFAKKSPLKANTGSSGSVRKSPLKTWNRQAGTPNNTGIDHLRPNTSSGSSLKTINKSGSSRKPLHVSLLNISILTQEGARHCRKPLGRRSVTKGLISLEKYWHYLHCPKYVLISILSYSRN